MGANILDIEKIEISDEYNSGFIDFEWDPSQCLFVWKGAKSDADKIYSFVWGLMKESAAHFGKLSHCDKAQGSCAYIMINGDLSPQQKYIIAEGIKSKGYTIKIEPRRF